MRYVKVPSRGKCLSFFFVYAKGERGHFPIFVFNVEKESEMLHRIGMIWNSKQPAANTQAPFACPKTDDMRGTGVVHPPNMIRRRKS